MSFLCGVQGQAFGSQPRIPSNSTFSDVTFELEISTGGNMDTMEISQHYTAGLFPPAEPADRHSPAHPCQSSRYLGITAHAFLSADASFRQENIRVPFLAAGQNTLSWDKMGTERKPRSVLSGEKWQETR